MATNKPKILFVNGSMNQTTQMFQIYQYLKDDFDCWFTQFFPDRWYEKMVRDLGLMEATIMSGPFRENAEKFVADHGLQYDYAGRKNRKDYALVFLCTDALVPRWVKKTKSIFVQEGMTDPLDRWAKVVKKLNLPGYFALRTALNGSMNLADVYTCASPGYKEQFSRLGTQAERILVTGMPNFDDCATFLQNDFPYHQYVLVCTSDIRETLKKEDRIGFIKEATHIAAGRPMIFKLHPNEIWERAYNEIMTHAPEGTLVFQRENTNHMIANCDELICQYSTVVYVGMALGKKVHSYFDEEELKRLMPIQNGGTSAERIADVARSFMDFKGDGISFCTHYKSTHQTVSL